MTLADAERQGRVWRLGAATVTAAGRIGIGMRRVRVFNDDVLERFMLGVALSQAAHFHDGVDLLGEGATPAMGFRLGGQGGVNDLLFVGARPQPLAIVSHH
jgi:hypothetical protein